MYRTDKQFMTNPATASSRVYIGFLPKTVVASDLEEKFRIHGKILGLVQQQGFAFIQFEHEGQAQAAIQNENFTMLHGRKITVKQALDKSKVGNQNQNQGNQNQPNNQNQANNLNKKNAPVPPSPQVKIEPPPLSFQKPPPLFPKPPPTQEPPKPEPEKEKQEKAPPPQTQALIAKINAPEESQGPPPPKHDGSLERRGRKRRIRSRDRFQKPADNRGDMYRDDGYYPPPQYQVPPPVPVIDQPDRNDCEIIVVSKALTKYAEYIEQRLKSLGLIVDLLFPNEDVPIGRVLANISSRGCLYAILVMPQNEEHRSLTLNILHGIAQEHRNMPIEDALVLMTRNFEAYMRGDKSAAETLGPGGVMNISDRHPTPIQLLLNLLAENRQITSTQYDRLLKYLEDRREVQHQHEAAEGVEPDSQEGSKQTELQNRIMNILNKSAENPPPAVAEPPPQKEEVAPPLLKDPSVQKALDSLLGGDMFKNIAGGH